MSHAKALLLFPLLVAASPMGGAGPAAALTPAGESLADHGPAGAQPMAGPVAGEVGLENQQDTMVPTSEKFFSKPPASIQCRIQTGTTPPTFSPNPNGPTPEDIVNAALAWLNDVCTVDSFLNNPRGATPLETVIAFANDEPTQLKTLSSVLGLSEAGKRAAAVLEANFPSVPGNLYNLQNGKASAAQVTTAINFTRCCTVLPAIDVLIKEASDASGAFRPGPIPKPVFPAPCRAIFCAAGASPST